jgi:hypothetical protein|tara:strand:+ start:623 stop:1006 length:384 start_codon:yes stop_codon:yes gene_type:complete
MRKKPFKMKGYTYPGTSPIKDIRDIVPQADVKMPRTSGDAVLVGAASKLGSSYTPVGVEYGLDMQPINIKNKKKKKNKKKDTSDELKKMKKKKTKKLKVKTKGPDLKKKTKSNIIVSPPIFGGVMED